MWKETAIIAYQSLGYLSNLLDDVYDRIEIQYPPLDAQPFHALRQSVDFFLCQVNAHSAIKSEKMRQLRVDIATLAHVADEIIDAHIVDLLHMEERYMGHSTFSKQMERLNQAFQKIKIDLLIAIEEGDDTQGKEQGGEDTAAEEREDTDAEEGGGNTKGENAHALKRHKDTAGHASSATSSHARDDYVVGLEDKLIEIKDQLINDREKHLKIITITGMGGIGKTTLAKTVYRDPFISQHFDIRLWVAVSQNYVREQVLQGLLDSGEKKFFSSGLRAIENHRQSGESLGDLLYKGLFNRRYLVVMDDVWSKEVWDDLHWFFPTQGNGSGILMTTRDSILASSLSSALNLNRMDFLNMDNSWKLLCHKAFSQGGGPIGELEEVGKNIARGCKGLPLSIVVIGSMLATSSMTREYWESVAKDVNSFPNLRDDGHCLKVLSLSYNKLPIHLKACFLFMFRITTSSQMDPVELIGAWISWGLIHQVQHRSKESVAEEYFRTLVGMNLILIRERYANGEISICGLHDLLRELCRKEDEENIFIALPIQQCIEAIAQQKACVLCGKQCGDMEEFNLRNLIFITPSSSHVSPSMCEECTNVYRINMRHSLVKVMDIVGEYSSQELVHPTRVQRLSIRFPNDIKFVSPSSAHLLWRLHTLVIKKSDSRTTPIVLPSEIWRMPQLKVISVIEAVLTYPSHTNMEGSYFIILKNLYRLERIRKFRCSPEVVCRIPNLRELIICDGDDSDSRVDNSLCNLAMFQKLEWLEVDMPIFALSKNISFPNTLKRLRLRRTRIPWEDITMIGSLPHLEWLWLEENAFIGAEWNPTEGEFLRLKVLCIRSHDDLLYWNAEETHFPKLETLALRGIHQELGIPDGIGHTPNLKRIALECCDAYVIYSAIQIVKEQREDYGNEDLLVIIEEKDGRQYKFGGGS